ncbi:Crp/Fnr family transcriptional regulator [Nafulsella turpanensis]|uniref:Crp/Fnr family transcriptional regulator n=1 Tax=Nafulsella turpanensis TaxID=1265690 RepID=UPI00034BB3FC|nr:Crp/Fnr family transcriptional regulator [Nafulsella turpanensis]
MIEPFFDYLRTRLTVTETQLSQLEPLLKVKQVKKGQILLRVGEVCQYTSFVLSGCLRSYVIDTKGREHIIQFAPENWWISEQISLYKKEPAMYFIDAIEDTSFLSMDPSFLESLYRIVPEARPFMDQALINSLRSFQKRLVSQLSESGEQRYLAFIRTYPTLALRLPLWMIASYLGLTPESLSRIRKELAGR